MLDEIESKTLYKGEEGQNLILESFQLCLFVVFW